MKVNSVDNKTSFGWRFKTHEKITGIILEDFPKLEKYKNTITKFVTRPDFDERGFKGNNHFYYPPRGFRHRESFFDFFACNNAAARYTIHMYEFDRFVNRDNQKAMEHAGRALHFLQDVTQPQHTERGTILKKWKDLKIHKEFENYTLDNQDKFISKALEGNAERGGWYKDYDYNDKDKLFNFQVAFSTAIPPANKENKLFWDYIAQYGITNAVEATKGFLNIVSSRLK